MADKPVDEAQKLDFVGMEDVLAIYSDAFFVANAGDMFTIYFFQNQLPDVAQREIARTETIKLARTKCIGRIVVSPNGMAKLVDAMATNMGFTLVKKAAAVETK